MITANRCNRVGPLLSLNAVNQHLVVGLTCDSLATSYPPPLGVTSGRGPIDVVSEPCSKTALNKGLTDSICLAGPGLTPIYQEGLSLLYNDLSRKLYYQVIGSVEFLKLTWQVFFFRSQQEIHKIANSKAYLS